MLNTNITVVIYSVLTKTFIWVIDTGFCDVRTPYEVKQNCNYISEFHLSEINLYNLTQDCCFSKLYNVNYGVSTLFQQTPYIVTNRK